MSNRTVAFKFVDGNLIEMKDFEEWPSVFVERIPEQPKRKLVTVTLTPRMRRFYARKGRPRRQAKRVAKKSTELRFSPISFASKTVWYRHAIATTDPPRFPWHEPIRRLVCFVYLPKGVDVGDDVLRAVDRWDCERLGSIFQTAKGKS